MMYSNQDTQIRNKITEIISTANDIRVQSCNIKHNGRTLSKYTIHEWFVTDASYTRQITFTPIVEKNLLYTTRIDFYGGDYDFNGKNKRVYNYTIYYPDIELLALVEQRYRYLKMYKNNKTFLDNIIRFLGDFEKNK